MPLKLLSACTLFALFALSSIANAYDFDVESIRITLSKPDTSQTLVFEPEQNRQKSVFLLTPVNQERLGVFVDINGIEIGYSADITSGDNETKTQNILLSYRKWKHSRITFNYQILEGLFTEAENLSGPGFESRFLSESKSTRIEVFGLHNFYTFNEGESLFEHFFLNRPYLSDKFDWSLSVIGGWSYKHLKLESPTSILFSPTFLDSPPSPVTELESDSISANIGPFLSVNMPNNFNFFAEYKVGVGYIRNTNSQTGLKDSGDEKANALGAGISWTSKNKKHLMLFRAWNQKGRHIETSFGDLSYLYFF